MWFSVWICLRSDFGFRSKFVFVPNLVFLPEFRLVRICLLCTFVFGPNFLVVFIWFSVRFCLCSDFVGSPNLVFTPDLCLVWICFSVRICLWYENAAVPNLVFGPEFPSGRIFLWSYFFFGRNLSLDRFFSGPNLSVVRIYRRTKCNFRSGLTLVSDPNLSLFRIWFSVRSFVWSEFVFCALLFLVRTCRWSLSGFRYELVFNTILSLVQIWFLLRICVLFESVFLSEFVFGMKLPLFRIWFSGRSFLRSEFFFCALLFVVRTCRWPVSGFRYDFVVDLILSFPDYVASPNLVFTPDLSLVWILFLNRICL